MKKQPNLLGKITKTTLKSFIRDKQGLYVRHKSRFDGMTDGVEQIPDSRLELVKETTQCLDKSYGIEGLWVTSDRNLFKYYNDGQFEGIEIYNCCGSSIVCRKIVK